MRHIEGSFQGSNGLQLFCQTWLPEKPPTSVLAIVHGFGEHSGRYMNLVNYFVPLGYALCSFDLRGHGRSPGARGHIRDWSEYRLDVDAFLRNIGKDHPGLSLFLYGHSLGGLIVLDYVLHEPVALKGVIASAPALGQVGISPVLLALSKIMSRIHPAFSIKTALDVSTISRDQSVVSAYVNDPLVHSIASARMGTELSATQQWVQNRAANLRIPLLLYQGAADRLVDPEGGKRFFENVPDGDKQYITYTGAFHEVHNDYDQQNVLKDIADWLEHHF